MGLLDMGALAALCHHEETHASQAPRRAVVVGGSLAGLLAARVLHDHFDEVWLLDRHPLPADDEPRRATPHTRHTHALLARGRQAIEALFPGIGEAWTAAGGRLGDVGSEAAFYAGRRRFLQAPAQAQGLCLGRGAIEGALRRRVLALPRLRAVTGIDAQGLAGKLHGDRIDGLRWRSASDEPRAPAATLRAALVVDATGRASRLPEWLAELGHATPDEQEVQVDIRYATAYLKRAPHHAPGLEAVITAATADHPVPSVLLSQEDQRWVVTLGGYGDDAPPLDRAGFIARAQRTAPPELAAVVQDAEFLCEPFAYRFPHSQRRFYERLRLPLGVLAIGDSICSFNPVFGQGMSVAACEAEALQAALAGGEQDLARRYFRAAARVVDIAWQTAVGADLAIPSVQGERPLPVRVINAYVARVFDAAQHDAVVAVAFQRVSHLLAAPPSLMRPAIAARVLRAWWRSRGATTRPAPPRAVQTLR